MTTATSRVVVHDYSGHPGQAQLSRALARRGYEVTHQHCPAYATGKGSLEREPGDPVTLRFESCDVRTEFNRYSYLTRVRHEVEYGRKVRHLIADSRPDVVILSNVPLIAHAIIARHLSGKRIPMVFWHQDIYSEAISATARKRLPVLGRMIGAMAERVERRIARRSTGVVAISPTFLEKLSAWGVADKSIVVPNWAPIDELPVRASANAWSERMGLADHPVVLYSGTLGLKHDPSILALMAAALEVERPEARLVVISEGKGREWLEEWKLEHGAANLVLLDYQPYGELPDVLASADVLVAILEPDASRFSVPSKVLTYLCAGRSILGVIPPDNSVAEIIINNGAGHVVDPSRRDQVAERVVSLLNDAELRQLHGKSGRAYAEATFSADGAAEQFIGVFGPWVSQPETDAPLTQQALGDGALVRTVTVRPRWETARAQAAS